MRRELECAPLNEVLELDLGELIQYLAWLHRSKFSRRELVDRAAMIGLIVADQDTTLGAYELRDRVRAARRAPP